MPENLSGVERCLDPIGCFLATKLLGIFFPIALIVGPICHLLKEQEHLQRSYCKVQERLKLPLDGTRHDFWTYISKDNSEHEASLSMSIQGWRPTQPSSSVLEVV